MAVVSAAVLLVVADALDTSTADTPPAVRFAVDAVIALALLARGIEVDRAALDAVLAAFELASTAPPPPALAPTHI
jgi:hypothetical protein